MSGVHNTGRKTSDPAYPVDGSQGFSKNSPIASFISPSSLTMKNRDFGEVTVSHSGKTSGTNRVNLNIKYTTLDGSKIDYDHSVEVKNNDEYQNGKSSVGYFIIDFPKTIQGKGIGVIYHAMVADIAHKLKVDETVINGVDPTSPMKKLCEKLNMEESPKTYGYKSNPSKLHDVALNLAISSGWSF